MGLNCHSYPNFWPIYYIKIATWQHAATQMTPLPRESLVKNWSKKYGFVWLGLVSKLVMGLQSLNIFEKSTKIVTIITFEY